MLKRKVYDDLLQWKNKWNNKACLINGARQVGKTFTVREFAKANYETVYELNFLENSRLKSVFSGSLAPETILASIRLNFPEKGFSPSKTLIFLDEIQECPEAITALKFLSKDDRFDVVATGSALGIAYESVTSFPVGSVYRLTMHSLSFEEFLWAKSVDVSILDIVRTHFETKEPVTEAINTKMMELLREFLVVGGMPEVVQDYVDSNDLAFTHLLQKNIYSDYMNDIARFTRPEIKIKAEECYHSIPQQLEKENHKFQYSQVEKRGTARKFESSVDWLVNAQLAQQVFNVSKVEFPLQSFERPDNFRLYMNDVGLFVSTFDISVKQALLNDPTVESVPNNLVLKTAKGGIYEALAADILLKNDHANLYFYRNEQGNVEIDFLIDGDAGPIPLEIKAGTKTKTKSLNRVLDSDGVAQGYKFGSQNIGVSGKKVTMPLYMLMFV